MPIGTTITEFIIEEQRQIKGVSGDFTALINDIVIACKAISSAVRYGSLVGVLGTADTENIQGETRKNWMSSPITCSSSATNGLDTSQRWLPRR